uniref:Uncharacterized protein n=1 Tax=viral metagenome TaxID=1070528 RepID=A0A6C0DPM7_9ZZZZ
MADLFKSIPKIEKMTKLEILLLIIFIIYLIFPIGTPEPIKSFIISPMGYVTIFIITLGLFFYSHPILAILYIFVAYELLNRSNVIENKRINREIKKQIHAAETATNLPSKEQESKDAEMVSMNPPANLTLEEEVVNKLAPIGVSHETNFVITGFQPVTDNIGSAANFM